MYFIIPYFNYSFFYKKTDVLNRFLFLLVKYCMFDNNDCLYYYCCNLV